MTKPLEGRIALVTGATRGAGRGIAEMLGEAGATVYCTGRSVRGRPASGTRPETIEETAESVCSRGGRGIAVRCDHTVPEEVEALRARIESEAGVLHVLVNDIWGGDELVDFGKPFWELDPERMRIVLERAVWSHLVTSRHLVPLMRSADRGLVVEVTDGDSFGYRGNLIYDLVKMSVIRLAFGMSRELRRTRITSLAVTPGFLRSEAMLDIFGVTEANWREGAKRDPNFIASETPCFVGRAIAALAADPKVASKAGRVFSSWKLSREYGFTDIDGERPDWGAHFEKTYGPVAEADYSSWWNGPMEAAFPEFPEQLASIVEPASTHDG